MKNNSSSSSAVGGSTALNNEASTLVIKNKTIDEGGYDESDEEVDPLFADISPHPMEVLSHFIIVSDGSVKTPKYRCKCCKYEFTASSTTRLKQHIMGYEIYAQETPKKVVKDIKECSKPYLPLKEALIIEFNNNRAHKRPRESSGGHLLDTEVELNLSKSARKKMRGSDVSKTPSTWNEASISAISYNEICTKASFDDQCPEMRYAEAPTFTAGNAFKSDAAILEWLETVIGDWIAASSYLAYREGSSLRYAVYEVLKSVTVLSEAYRLFAYSGSFDSSEALVAIDRFTSRNLNQSSMTAETPVPVSIDTTNAGQVKELYSAIGRYINGRGRVDFGIVDRNNSSIKCIVEIVDQLDNPASDKVNGFWEMMHDLVHSHYFNGAKSPLYGLLTDYRNWVFFKLEGNEIQYSNTFNLFHGEFNTPEFTDHIYPLFKILFEIFSVSNNANLKQKSEAVSVFKKNYAEAGLLSLKDNLKIAQEIKKKDDEISKLKEELAKLKSKTVTK